jgi:hypothetical protein
MVVILSLWASGGCRQTSFLDELCQFHLSHAGPWLVIGDLNMIYQAADKNNDCLNRRLMGQFCLLLNDAILKEIHLTGRLFTWSNECVHPTLEHIN